MKTLFSYFVLPDSCFFVAGICVMFSALLSPLFAQAQAEIKGVLADSISTEKLAYVTISLKDEKNATVKTALTNEDGFFALKSLHQGKYTIHIVAMGYKRKTISIDLTRDTDLFTIYLNPESTLIEAVTVTADKPIVKVDSDKISYDLQADPESKVNSVLDMIRKVPMLSLDHEDNIQLKGSGNYRILINGKPSSMMERNPKDVLRSMPASTIQSIEVITNPPAKYDGEGLAGIINIVTVKKIDNGYNGNVNASFRFPRGGPGLGSSFNFKQGKLGVSANAYADLFDDPSNINFNTRIVKGDNPSDFRQEGARDYRSRGTGISTQLSFEIDSLNLISGQVGTNVGEDSSDGSLSSLLQIPSGIVQSFSLNNRASGNRRGMDASMNYQLGFKRNKKQLLTLSYRFFRFSGERTAQVLVGERLNYAVPDYNQANEGGSREQTLQVDYVQPVRLFTVESGVKAIFRDNRSEFRYNSKTPSGSYVLNPAFSNNYENTQNVYSFYNSWQANLKDWELKAGIRLEETLVDASFISSGIDLKQNYLNLLPSVSLSRKLKDKINVGFGYSQRIQRPSIWDLNPFVDRSNPNLERTGNPNLKPVVANNFQLTFNKSNKTSFSAVLSHSFSNNALQYYLLYDAGNNINILMPDNTGTNKTSGININVSHPISSRWNVNLTTNLNYVEVEGYVENELTKNDGFTGNFMVSSGYRFENGLRITGNTNYLLSPYINIQGQGIAILFCQFGLTKDFFKEKLSFSAQVSNPFNKYVYFPNNIKTAEYDFVSSGRGWFRGFSYSLNYKFGKLKSSVAKNKRGINNDDVDGGARL